MKADISRQTFDPKRHYSRVVMQQGRVQLDADWNEQQEIFLHRLETQSRDTIGASGVPQRGGGFQVNFLPGGRDLLISPGRMYVDGILCELNEGTAIDATFSDKDILRVDDWEVDGRSFEAGQWIELLDGEWNSFGLFQITDAKFSDHKLKISSDQVHFEVSTAKEPRNYRIRRIITYTTQPDYPNPAFTRHSPDTNLLELNLQEDPYLLLIYLDVWQRHISALDDPHIREVALGGPDTTTRMQTVCQVKLLPVAFTPELQQMIEEDRSLSHEVSELRATGPTTSHSKPTQRINEIVTRLEALQQDILMLFDTIARGGQCREWDMLIAPHRGTLNASTFSQDDPESSGFRGTENQLYRVEIHEGTDDSSPPTYKWARNNASILTKAEIKDSVVTIFGTGQGSILNFSRNQFVEVVDDLSDLNVQPGSLVEITDVDSTTGQITLESVLGPRDAVVKLRLWDGIGVVDMSDTWLPLDPDSVLGISIKFSPGMYKSGDYWLIPARKATGEIEWPPYQVPNTNSIPQPPHGIQHHYTRLASVRHYLTRSYPPLSFRDCRRIFSPLIETSVSVAEAMHIVSINWLNGSRYPSAFLKEEGLHIKLDAKPDPQAINVATMIVTLESTLHGGGEGTFIMHGVIEVKDDTIIWRWRGEEKGGFIAKLLERINVESGELFNASDHPLLVRIKLKGHAIWSDIGDRLIHLDGQTFGKPGFQANGQQPWVDLQFPSGGGARASDFESWLYLHEGTKTAP